MERRNIYPDGVVFRAYPDGETQQAEGARACLITYHPAIEPVRISRPESRVNNVTYLKAWHFGKQN